MKKPNWGMFAIIAALIGGGIYVIGFCLLFILVIIWLFKAVF